MDRKEWHVKLGARLKEARKSRHMSQRTLARKVGIGDSAVCGYERADHEPSAYVLAGLAKALDVSLAELMGVK